MKLICLFDWLKANKKNVLIMFFSRFIGILPDQFENLLSLVEEKVKNKTKIRELISPVERPAITAIYLVSGDIERFCSKLDTNGNNSSKVMKQNSDIKFYYTEINCRHKSKWID